MKTITNFGTGRPNTDLAAAVDQALALAEEQGVPVAAAFLTARGAGFALTCRVLAEPERRRSVAGPPIRSTSAPRPRIPT